MSGPDEVSAETCFNWAVRLSPCRLLSFPTNLINASDTRRGIAKAFTLWSDVSPFSFREVPADEEADIKIGERPLVALSLCPLPGADAVALSFFSMEKVKSGLQNLPDSEVETYHAA